MLRAEQLPILPRSAEPSAFVFDHAPRPDKARDAPRVRVNSPTNNDKIERLNTSGLAQFSTGGSQWSGWRGWLLTDEDLCRRRGAWKRCWARNLGHDGQGLLAG